MKLTHIGREDICVATVEDFTFEVRSQRTKTSRRIILQGNVAVRREGSGLQKRSINDRPIRSEIERTKTLI